MRPVTVSVGPNATGGTPSQLVRFDDYSDAQVSIQCDVNGTVNYTIQTSLDDPNSPTNPVPLGSMTWINSSDAAAVGATANIATNFAYKPAFARVVMNSGSGTVTATFTQAGGGNY